MNFRKILMKITGILAGLLVVALIGLTIYQSHLVKRMKREAAIEGEVAGNLAPEDEATDREALKQQSIEFQRKMLEDPTIRESIRTGLEAQYKPLFEALLLSPEPEEKLTELLTNSVVEYLELNPEVLAAVTDEEKEVLQRRYDYLRKETQLRVEALLGHDAYEKYQAYEDRAFPRTVVSGFAETLEFDDRLTSGQERELIEIIHGESQKVYADIGYDPTSRLEFPSDMEPETISKKMEITNSILFNSADGASDILSKSQLKVYNDHLRVYIEQVEMSLIKMHQQYGE